MPRPIRVHCGLNPQNRAHAEAIAAAFDARLYGDLGELPGGVKRGERWVEVLFSGRKEAEVTIWANVDSAEVRERFEKLATDPDFPTKLVGDVRVLRPVPRR